MRKIAVFLFALALPGLTAAQDAPERRILTGNIAEYSFKVPVGPGANDVIGIHRVVREDAPGVPARAKKALMMAHGDIWGFRPAFLSDPVNNLPVYLAENGIDVWGIDYRWTQVPGTTTDFSFMQDWGIEQDARDLGVALGVARSVRLATGNGFGKMLLLGWSRGGQIGYAYLNAESQVPPGLRQVSGFIPTDIYLKTDNEDFRQAACTRYLGSQAQLDAGTYQNPTGVVVSLIGQAAVANPNDASQFIPGFTNHQASLAVGSLTFILLPPGLAPVPLYHFTGGSFEPTTPLPTPTGLLYSPESSLLALELGASPFEPVKVGRDADASTCDDPSIAEVAFDDHLADIKVPVFYLGANGGFGESGIYTTTLLGSQDVTSHVVDLQPAAAQLVEIGHGDIFLATDGESLFWQPVLSWIQGH
ncbi:MAG TPA: hypothetical protein VNM67_22595 [Thermoanaerobaculia bacterium]|jgi:hypothetical protein|nr:hypothetical protein [Thermoanaerobaculia bacterium]